MELTKEELYSEMFKNMECKKIYIQVKELPRFGVTKPIKPNPLRLCNQGQCNTVTKEQGL